MGTFNLLKNKGLDRTKVFVTRLICLKKNDGSSSKRSRLAQLATNFLESFNSKIKVVSTDLAKVIGKFPDPSKPDPSKSNLVEEIKKLRLTDEDEIDLAIKFSHNQQYEKFFWEFEGSQRMTFVRKIMRM
ncbi:hypothetical protein MTR_2g092920 [Medicago truncatula]|uniref:Uncharacterized protein n=1 Tax=Medicago truncatula TaxID=3880 RepID=G7IU24_MEDTR|nr:hypothetical protein MTR_2g092920 [Medicago truncatula]